MSPKLMESRKGGTSTCACAPSAGISLKGELTPPVCSNEVGTGGVNTLCSWHRDTTVGNPKGGHPQGQYPAVWINFILRIYCAGADKLEWIAKKLIRLSLQTLGVSPESRKGGSIPACSLCKAKRRGLASADFAEELKDASGVNTRSFIKIGEKLGERA